MDSAIADCYILSMKNTPKDRYDKKLLRFMNELCSWDGSDAVGLPYRSKMRSISVHTRS